ncbi:MAG TPA: hypothetical protein VGL46_13225 [Pseudonocardiaceae bacterium]|jgi:hypothetical protein
MTDFYLWVIGVLGTGVVSLGTYSIRSLVRTVQLRSEVDTWRGAFEREKERVTDMVAVQRDAQQAKAIGINVADSLGKVIREAQREGRDST